MNFAAFIQNALSEASQIALNNFGKVSGKTKAEDNNQVLTDADLEIGRFLINKIKSGYPNDNIIDEESGVIDNKSKYTWVIDPIDGTSNFAQGIPLYGIMIGLLQEDKPIAGGIAMPSLNELYYGEKYSGSYCNNERVHATSEAKLLNTLVSYTIDGHQEKPELTRNEAKIIGEVVLNIRNLRASGCCFDLAMVAKGKYGAAANQTGKIWDNVAPQVILEEAGCKYTDFFGKEISYKNPLSKAEENFTLCAAPEPLHSQLQKIIYSC